MKQNKKALIVIFFTVFIDLIGFGIIIPLNPYLARQFGADAFQVGLLMSVYSGMQFLFSPFWGHLSDKFGRRPIILISLFGAAIAHLAFAFGDSLWILFFARAFAGIFGANISTAMAYIADVTEGKDRSKGMGLIGAAFGLGFILGPFIGGIAGRIGESLGSVPPWGGSFPAVVASVICFGNFILAFFVLKETLALELRKKASKRASRLSLIFKYLKTPILGHLMFVYFLSIMGMAHMEASLFMYVQDIFSWSLVKASFGFAYVGIIMVFTQGFLIRKIIPQYGERKVMIVGLLTVGTGLSMIGWAHSIPVMAVAVTLLGLGSGLVNPALTGSVSLVADKSEQGVVMGVNQSLAALSRILGPALGGWFYRDIGAPWPFWVAGIFSFIGLLVALTVYKALPSQGEAR